jgi:hypothetical protein
LLGLRRPCLPSPDRVVAQRPSEVHATRQAANRHLPTLCEFRLAGIPWEPGHAVAAVPQSQRPPRPRKFHPSQESRQSHRVAGSGILECINLIS